jgi:putative hydrolase of the HAD superfamily
LLTSPLCGSSEQADNWAIGGRSKRMATKWVLFDGDNTLWNVEALYDDARKEFCEFVLQQIREAEADRDQHIDLRLIEKCQRHRDLQLYKSLGYSASRFAKSFEDTLKFLLPTASSEIVSYAHSLAKIVFSSKAKPVDHIERTLSALTDAGYSLAIFTAGERSVQQKRLKDFYLSTSFRTCAIVESKTEEEFRRFCLLHAVDASVSWMVGDSVRSDILPAQAAGLNAIHVQVSNWSAERGEMPETIRSVSTLEEILPIIFAPPGPI